MLRWIIEHTSSKRIRNEDIKTSLGAANIEKKIIDNGFKWFGQYQRTSKEDKKKLGHDGIIKKVEKDHKLEDMSEKGHEESR